jgi:hypothetical protein
MLPIDLWHLILSDHLYAFKVSYKDNFKSMHGSVGHEILMTITGLQSDSRTISCFADWLLAKSISQVDDEVI